MNSELGIGIGMTDYEVGIMNYECRDANYCVSFFMSYLVTHPKMLMSLQSWGCIRRVETLLSI